MKNLLSILTVILTLPFISCATTGGGIPGQRNGAAFEAAEVKMVATSVWGSAVQIARFRPAVFNSGVECIEVAMPYGETAAVWHFSGLDPQAPVEFIMDVNVDFFMKDSFISILLLPGAHGAGLGTWPKPDWVQNGLAFKWIDSVGRFAGEPHPDATSGWETLRSTDFAADAAGDFTVLLMVNHYTENPPIVYAYITNPSVRTHRQQ